MATKKNSEDMKCLGEKKLMYGLYKILILTLILSIGIETINALEGNSFGIGILAYLLIILLYFQLN